MKIVFKVSPLLLILGIMFPSMLLCAGIIESPKQNWWAVFFFIPVIIMNVLLVAQGIFNPIVMMAEGVKYKRQKIEWKDVCITLLPYEPRIKTKNYRNGYYVIFDNEFVQGKIARKRLRKGKWVMLSKKSLNYILNYYDKPFHILSEMYEDNNQWGTIRSKKEFNELINSHNAKCNDLEQKLHK